MALPFLAWPTYDVFPPADPPYYRVRYGQGFVLRGERR